MPQFFFNYLSLLLLLVFSISAPFIFIKIILPKVRKVLSKKNKKIFTNLINVRFFYSVSFILPPLIIFFSLKNIDVNEYENINEFLLKLKRIAGFFIIIYVPFLLNKFLSAISLSFKSNHFFIRYPINTYLQLIKLVIVIVSIVLAICYLLNTSPWGVLSGIGALGAILLLVFKDTILGLVASIQVYGGNLIKEGDWIELKNLDIDGEVLEVGLHRVKVKAWDNSVATFPTSKLLDLTFKNWRNMKESGGRRIKRDIIIKTSSIKFADETLLKKISSIDLLKQYISKKTKEIEKENNIPESNKNIKRKLTNVGCFRIYIKKYLENNKNINKKMTLMVRQKALNQYGLPLEIYAFTSNTDWLDYEDIQSDIFDHILASTKLFELSVYQSPSSYDLNNFIKFSKI
ncbi:MAG: Miniconductance mechanosensitive channel YbdG [Alphaproteobacteria bacterium MarineAlpha9_Bin4]|nr:MAG: Miniconductance mechanosensitive channel YbdG [Alphaproteobacteria bacterium MarineAlpha9_Bin4]